MRLQLSTKPLSTIKPEYLILPILEGMKADEVYRFKDPAVLNFLKINNEFGKPNETQFIYLKDQTILFVGLGKKEDITYETIQNLAGTAAKALLKKTKEAVLFLPRFDSVDPEKITEAIAIGVNIATHDPSSEFKSKKEKLLLNSLEIIVDRADKGFQDGLRKGTVFAEAINQARYLADLPANIMTPEYFLGIARKVARENKLKITVLDKKKAEKLGMGAFCAVASGSVKPSYMIALEYAGNIRTKDKWGLVGKGITFDSGGLSIKPAASMAEMKYDMSGAANVLAIMQVVAKFKLRTNAVGIMVVTENLPSAQPMRPGDILKSYSGKSVEVLNTDAEGRLVLIDGLSWAQKDFKANKLIDMATLTGAMVVALGDFITGVFGNNHDFASQLIQAGAKVGERFWEMPMLKEYQEMNKSEFGDITNIGHGGSMPGAAGSITAAKFIEEVIENEGGSAGKKRSWLHLDIAGTAWDMKPKPYRGVGATGVGIKTLVELLFQG